jgi:hypothetical protein
MRIIVSIPAELPEAQCKTAADRLKKDGWTDVDIGAIGPTLSHPEVASEAEARSRLRAAQLDPDLFDIETDPDDQLESFDLA